MYYCGCGVAFKDPVDKKIFNEKYAAEYAKEKMYGKKAVYPIDTYVPIIEEIIYSRKFLDVGFTHDIRIKEMQCRGWVSSGIDLIPNEYIHDDFETFDFGTLLFDLVFLWRVLESFENPLYALLKVYNILRPQGMVLISTPDTELIFYNGFAEWGNWNTREHHILFSERKLREELVKMGFKIILARKNLAHRYSTFNDVHILAQK